MPETVPLRDVRAAANNIRQMLILTDETIAVMERAGRAADLAPLLSIRDAYAACLRILEAHVRGV